MNFKKREALGGVEAFAYTAFRLQEDNKEGGAMTKGVEKFRMLRKMSL